MYEALAGKFEVFMFRRRVVIKFVYTIMHTIEKFGMCFYDKFD